MEMWQILQVWDENIDLERKQKLRAILNGDELLFFFKKNNEIYGCPEESRLIFAKLKNPDEDVTPSWNKEAGFLALNLSRSLTEGDIPKRLFYKKDMKNIEILDKEQAMKELAL